MNYILAKDAQTLFVVCDLKFDAQKLILRNGVVTTRVLSKVYVFCRFAFHNAMNYISAKRFGLRELL